MNILWITNITFPEALELLHKDGAIKGSGGWMVGAAEALVKQQDIKLAVASISPDVKGLTRLDGKSVTYYLLPYGKGNSHVNHDYEPLWDRVKSDFCPEVVHIHGTEFSHGLAWIKACGAEHTCVSIQGLRHASYYYYHYGITKNQIRLSATPVSVVFGSLIKMARKYKSCGEYEKEVIRQVNHIIGRTSWDRARTWVLNPDANYYHGGETMRSIFYSDNVWSYSSCISHSIFLSQARDPIKGLHQMLRAMPIILRHYPDTIIKVAGPDITRGNSWKDLIRLSDYGNIIRKLIKKYNLKNHICFTGSLDSEGMLKEYLKCNVFVCPSTVENSPNSLAEAQLLGVPVVASYVGGVPDMMKGDEGHLYRFEEVEMLAYKVCEIFDNKENQPQVSHMRQEALHRHNPQKNALELMHIYNEVAK